MRMNFNYLHQINAKEYYTNIQGDNNMTSNQHSGQRVNLIYQTATGHQFKKAKIIFLTTRKHKTFNRNLLVFSWKKISEIKWHLTSFIPAEKRKFLLKPATVFSGQSACEGLFGDVVIQLFCVHLSTATFPSWHLPKYIHWWVIAAIH